MLAFRCGSVPEIIDPGVTGLIVDTVEGGALLPQVWRSIVTRSGGASRTVHRQPHGQNYLHVYHALLKQESLSERDTTMPLRQPVLEKEMN